MSSQQLCQIDNIKSVAQSNPAGALLIFTQEGCPHCPVFLKAANEAIGGKIKIVKAPVERKDCGDLATKYKVNRTPTAIYFDHSGKEKKRVPIANKTWGQIKDYLKGLPNGSSALKPKIVRKRKPARRRVRRSGEVAHLHG